MSLYELETSNNQDLTFYGIQSSFYLSEMKISMETFSSFKFIDSANSFTNLALLLSDQCPFSTIVAVFDGTDIYKIKDRYAFSGSLLQQINDVMSFIKQYNVPDITYFSTGMRETYPYPQNALYEAVSNAFIHRNYRLNGGNIINIYSDRIEIISLGGLTKGFCVEDFYQQISLSRNKYLADVFYRLHYIDTFGTGLKRMKNEYAETPYGPIIKVTPNTFKVILPNILIKKPTPKSVPNRLVDTKRVNLIINKYQTGKFFNREDIQNLLHISSSTATRLLKNMILNQLIVQHGSSRNTFYEII